MKLARIGAILIPAILVLSLGLPVMADDSADMTATVTVSGANVEVGVNVDAENSTVNINHGIAANVNGYADSTTNLVAGPDTTIMVNQESTVNGHDGSTTNIYSGTRSSTTVNQASGSSAIINGGRNSHMTVNAGPDFVVNLNGTSLTEAVRTPAGWTTQWNENVQVVNKTVLPSLVNLGKNTDILGQAVSRLIANGKIDDNRLLALNADLDAVNADLRRVQGAVVELAQQLTVMENTFAASAAEMNLNLAAAVSKDGQIDRELAQSQKLNSQQSALIQELNQKIIALEQFRYEREHSGFVYNVNTFFSTAFENIRGFFASVIDNIRSVPIFAQR